METPRNTQSDEQLNEWLRMSERDLSLSQDHADFSVDQLFESIEENPLGRLLKIISGMPEMRSEKLEIARRHIEQPDEILDANMDAAIDRVLEELFSQP